MTAAADLDLGDALPVRLRSGLAARSAQPRRTGLRAVTPVTGRRALSLVLPRRVDARRAPFIAVVVSLLVAGLLGLLMLNTVLAQGSFALFSLRAESRVLADREQSLLREVEALRSPEALAQKATELGMVQAGQPAFLRLPDGVVLGSDATAVAPELDPETGAVVPEGSATEDAATEDSATDGEATADEEATTDGEAATEDETAEDETTETDTETDDGAAR